MMEFKKSNILQIGILFLCFMLTQQAVETVNSFEQLGEYHCKVFSVELLWRLSSGSISEKYGEQYFDYDCYVRQFIKKDGVTVFEDIPSDEDSQEESEKDSEQQEEENTPLPIDPIVEQYAKGIKGCLPQGVDQTEAVYAIWRYMRFIVQNDYLYQWMRAKIRAGMGYQAQRPYAWMDGETKAQRLRLDKLFSNQFYDYVDQLMFKDFLYPIMTFLKKNTVLALSGDITVSGKPILVQAIETHNYLPQIFKPVIMKNGDNDIFSYTIPGIPLLLAGSNSKIAWGFTGVLVDRSNVEQIQTVNNRFYNHDTEQWIPLTVQQITIPGVPDKVCNFIHSASGTLYTKHNVTGKISEYISKWHQNERKVRVLFTDTYNFIKKEGVLSDTEIIEFPFNSIMFVNSTGIYQYLCPQFYPSYFLYPDMFGEPEKIENRWVTYTKKYAAVSNTLLTTIKQQSYKKGEILSPFEEQIAIQMRRHNPKNNKFTVQSAMNFLKDINTSPYIKKQRDIMAAVYRKVKFIYLPEEQLRKQCDQIISILEKWDNTLTNEKLAPIYTLWEYFLRDFTFNHVSASEYGRHLARHKAVSDLYWANQMALWNKGTSYGECESHQYEDRQHEYNGTGQNSTCYFNIMRGFNKTRETLYEKYHSDLSKINLADFTEKKLIDLSSGIYKGSDIQQAFGVHYSRNLFFGAEIDSQTVRYNPTGYRQSQQVDYTIKRDEEIQNPTDYDL